MEAEALMATMEPALHVILGLTPEEYANEMDEGRRSAGWADWKGMPATKDPRWHSHPLLGITGHSHSSTEDARRPHGHVPEIMWGGYVAVEEARR